MILLRVASSIGAPRSGRGSSLGSRRMYHESISRWFPIVALLWPLAGCDLFHTSFEDVEDAVRYRAAVVEEPSAAPDSLRVMNWNMKFGAGRIDFFFDCHGTRSLMTAEEVRGHMADISEVVASVDPDLLLIQEVDVESKRSAYVDQVQFILDNTPLNYAVYASQWRADYVPSDGIGRVNSGTAILSKYPLGASTRYALPAVPSYDALKRYFYLQRNVLETQLLVGAREDVWILATHAEAYSPDGTKRVHIDGFKEHLDRHRDQGHLVLGGGDLNTLPPQTGSVAPVADFPDSVCTDEEFIADDYSEESDWLQALYDDYETAIPLQTYLDDPQAHYTHTTDKDGFWNRKLDYMFTNGVFVPSSGETLQSVDIGGHETMPLSDHAPVVVQWEVAP
ncbi:MAG: endonuclease [Deltaproteobacteria bacterium]|nr:endonuclease [Deltaproteobacteria bacterium]